MNSVSKNKTLVLILLCIMNFSLYGCASLRGKPAKMTIHYQVSSKVNPDLMGEPAPIVVQIFQLKSAQKFQAANFFMLYQNSETTLGADLVRKYELELRPNQQLTSKYPITADVCCIGVLAAYRDIYSKQWRNIIKIKNYKRTTIKLQIGRSAVKVID